MKKDLYKSAIDKVPFDENLEGKIMDYVSENKEKEVEKVNMKKKFRFSTVAAACAICTLSVTAYAAVNHFTKVSHVDYGLVAINEESAITSGEDEERVLDDTSDIRAKLAEGDSDIEILKEEKGNDKVKWIKKTVSKDISPKYQSDDGKNWTLDETSPRSISTEYIYRTYEDAAKDAGLPNIMNKLMDKINLNLNPIVTEYSMEDNTKVIGKLVKGEFKYKKGRVNVEVKKDLEYKEGESGGYAVITGIEKATNQRSYKGKNGVNYEMSDNVNDGIKATTTMVQNGAYNTIIQFTDLSDSEIHTILDSLDFSELN